MQKQRPDSGSPTPNYLMSSVNNALRLFLLFRKQTSVRLMEACEYLGRQRDGTHQSAGGAAA